MENLKPSVIEAHRKSAIENQRSKIWSRYLGAPGWV